jgi:4-diphosphocytidyl-2-C-methyl-D-erythritol kinase
VAVTSLVLPSFAKVNLGLEVLGTREDGYHELRTIFQTVDLHDDVELRTRREGITLACSHPAVPEDATNLAWKAAASLAAYARVKRGVAIRITKRVPVAGGLGGGSSNAATVLRGLDHLWRLGLGRDGLLPVARRLGADVPYFLFGGTALGLSRGDEIWPLQRQVRAHFVIVDPDRPVSTAAVFSRVDATLTPRSNSRTIFRFISQDEGGAPFWGALSNDLEGAALEEAPDLVPRLSRIRATLVEEGACLAALSGSGSSYFGLFEDGGGARAARDRLARHGFRALSGRTLTLDQYQRHWSRALAAA